MMANSLKNQAMNASADLGLGDQLKNQADDEELQRRKKLVQQQTALGPATQSLFNMTGGIGG